MTQPRYKNRYRVESTRLPNRDYAANGWYFVTICTHNRVHFFGSISVGQVHLSPIGEIAQQFWLEIPNHFPHIHIDAHVIMPNHLHGIVVIDRPFPIETLQYPSNDVETLQYPSNDVETLQHPSNDVETLYCNVSTQRQFMSDISPKAGSLGNIMRSHKSAVTRWCHQNGFDNFRWQPRFYDRIIRADGSLDRIRQYIINNPANWINDQEKPANLWM